MTDRRDDVEPTLQALDEADQGLRRANHAAFRAPADPANLYARTGTVVQILQAPGSLAPGEQFGSDDKTPGTEHVDTALRGLATASFEISDALEAANRAFSATGHLKIDG